MDIKIKPVPYQNYCRGAGNLPMPGTIVFVSESVWYQNPRFYFFIFLIAMMWYVSLKKPADKLFDPDQTVIIKPARERIVEEVVVEKEVPAPVRQEAPKPVEKPPEVVKEVQKKPEPKPEPKKEILKPPMPAEAPKKIEEPKIEPKKKILPQKTFENRLVRKQEELNVPKPLENQKPEPLAPKPKLDRKPLKKIEQKPALQPEKIEEKRIASKQFEKETLQQKKVQPKIEEPRKVAPKSVAATTPEFVALAYKEKESAPDQADTISRPRLSIGAPGIETVTPEQASRPSKAYAEVDISNRRLDVGQGIAPSNLQKNDVQVPSSYSSEAPAGKRQFANAPVATGTLQKNESRENDIAYADVDYAPSDRLAPMAQSSAETAGLHSMPAVTEVQLKISSAVVGESMRLDNLKQRIYAVAQTMAPEGSPYCCTIGKYRCVVAIEKNQLVRIDFTPEGDVPFEVVSKLEREIHYKRMTQCSD